MSNFLDNLKIKEGSYNSGQELSEFVHDKEAVALLSGVLLELRKMNLHLEYLSGLNIEDYNIGDND